MKYLNTKPGSIEEVAASMSKYAAESEYQDMFKKELEKAGKGIGSMTPAEKKAFFNKIDTKYKAKDEQVKNPYAIGMAAAMKAKDDQPPLKKSTITKAHDIAKSIEKDMKKETHTFMTQKINQAKKSVPGEKQVVDPEPKISEPKAKMSFKEAYRKVKKEAMNTIGDANADKANQVVSQKDDSNDPDIKKPKGKTDAGTKPSAVDTSPEVEYKN
jgi:hypothetical protein